MWVDELGRTLGMADRKYAGHAIEEKLARKNIKDAKSLGATWDDYEKELIYLLYKEGRDRDLIDEQLAKAKKMWG